MEELEIMAWVQDCRKYALWCHESTNHQYGQKPYETHLQRVYEYATMFYGLLDPGIVQYALAAAWTHDVIEDCRQTYNDVRKVCGEKVADITYALTNEKGKTRKERANDKYYNGILNTPGAVFVKVCDRLANTEYSMINGAKKDMYQREFFDFQAILFTPTLKPMFVKLYEITFPGGEKIAKKIYKDDSQNT